jgi:putative transposase
MQMTEMTAVFSEAKEATSHGGWWLGFSSLNNGARRVQVPIASTPYLKDPSAVAKSVSARKDRKGRWVFQFTDKSETSIMAGPAGKVGVDVGLNVMAMTSDGHQYGATIKAKFNRLYERIKSVRGNRQRQGLRDNSKRLDVLEARLSGLVKSAAGRVTNQLIRDYPDHTFVVEDLDLLGCKGQKRFAYRAVQTSLERKATIERGNPAYTSQECPDCGYVSRRNRAGVKFCCRSCGRQIHAEVVGARGVLRRSEDKQITLKTPPHRVKELLQRRYLQRRNSRGAPIRTPVPSGPRLTTGVSKESRTASNQVATTRFIQTSRFE